MHSRGCPQATRTTIAAASMLIAQLLHQYRYHYGKYWFTPLLLCVLLPPILIQKKEEKNNNN